MCLSCEVSELLTGVDFVELCNASGQATGVGFPLAVLSLSGTHTDQRPCIANSGTYQPRHISAREPPEIWRQQGVFGQECELRAAR